MLAGLFKMICWIIFGAFAVTVVFLFIKLLAEGFSNPKRTTTIHWETEQGKKGTLTVESQRIKQPKRKRSQRPEWLRFLLEESPATIMERRRREKQRRHSDIE